MITENYHLMHRDAPFGNRSAEIASVLDLLDDGSFQRRALLFRTSKGIGGSAFLKRAESLVDPRGIAIYCDFWTDGLREVETLFKDERDRRLNYRIGAFLKALAPLFGVLSRTVLLWATPLPMSARVSATALLGIGEGILISPYASSTIARICQGLTTWPRRPVLFLIDNAEHKPREVLALMKACAADEHYRHARFILTYSDSDAIEPFDEFRKRLPFVPEEVVEGRFAPIDADFVSAVGEAHGLPLGRTECESLVRQADNDMWILTALLTNRAADGLGQGTPMKPMANFTLQFLMVSEQPLRRSDLRLLGLRSQLIVDDELADFDAALDDLQARRLIQQTRLEGSDSLIALASQSAPELRTIAKDVAGNLVAMRDLYDYFRQVSITQSTRHSASSSAALLYRLARNIDPAAIPGLAQRLVEVAMGQGSLDDAQQYIDVARPADGRLSLHDQFVQIAFFVSVQEYGRAKEVLDAIHRSEFERYRILRILDAVALNRIRSHADSDRRIDELLAENGTVEEKCLLISYKIGGMLHEEHYAGARTAFTKWRQSLRGAKNYPYLLRNAGAVYMWGSGKSLMRAEAVLAEAVERFVRAGDGFGIATARCNLGVAKAYQGDLASAEALFRESFDALSVLGTQHIQEAGTNLGTALLLNGERGAARKHFRKLLVVMDMDFPRSIAECNMAVLDLVEGHDRDALERIRALLPVVDDVIRIRDASRRVRLTAALVEAIVADSPERSRQYLQEASALRGGSDDLVNIEKAIDTGALTRENVLKFYPYEYLQYWSQNPLQMLPAQTLSAQTVFDHVA